MNKEIRQRTYEAFNRRDVDAVLERMSDDVDWPNGSTGSTNGKWRPPPPASNLPRSPNHRAAQRPFT